MNYITWLYFLVENPKSDDKKVIFLYGLSLPTSANISKTAITSEEVNGNKNKLIVAFTTISNVHPAVDSMIDFDGFIKTERYRRKVINNKEIIQVDKEVYPKVPNSLLGSPLKVKCFYTGDIYDYCTENDLYAENIEELIYITTVLEKMTGQAFKSTYVKRLGCYEIGEVLPWSETMYTPFDIFFDKNSDELQGKYYFMTKDTSYFKLLTIHLIVFNDDNEVVVDTIKNINNENKVWLVDVLKADNASCEYWIFDEIGNLIDRKKFTFVKTIQMNIGLMGGNYNIPTDTYAKKSALANKDRVVQMHSYNQSSTIQAQKNIEIEEQARILHRNMTSYVQNDRTDNNGQWFEKGEQDNIIEFFNRVTSQGAYKVVIVDPFLSSNASWDYLYHLSNQQITLQFISCWEDNISPDDSEKEKETTVAIKELQTQLDAIKDYNIPLRGVSWYNMKSKKFHDRFLYIENAQTGEKSVYSLSNSLNNMLKKYDLLILPLHGKVLKKSIFYIESLFAECSNDNKIYPKEN